MACRAELRCEQGSLSWVKATQLTSGVFDSAPFFSGSSDPLLRISNMDQGYPGKHSMLTDVLFEPTGTHGSWHSVWENLVTGAVFARALALACLFVFYFITA